MNHDNWTVYYLTLADARENERDRELTEGLRFIVDAELYCCARYSKKETLAGSNFFRVCP